MGATYDLVGIEKSISIEVVIWHKLEPEQPLAFEASLVGHVNFVPPNPKEVNGLWDGGGTWNIANDVCMEDAKDPCIGEGVLSVIFMR